MMGMWMRRAKEEGKGGLLEQGSWKGTKGRFGRFRL